MKLEQKIIKAIELHNEAVSTFPTQRELLLANKRLSKFILTSLQQAYEAGRKSNLIKQKEGRYEK